MHFEGLKKDRLRHIVINRGPHDGILVFFAESCWERIDSSLWLQGWRPIDYGACGH